MNHINISADNYYIGKTISHYRIIEKLGEGGMGVVYKGEDIRLNRPVALKFISPELTKYNEGKEQFIYEAQTASGLDHHNISTIYEIDETDDGRMFIAMAYYHGETLYQKILKGDIPIIDAVNIALQISEGLSKAHHKGIIHKDIKPANIIINEDDTIKIIDFGLSRLTTKFELPQFPKRMGTIAYMSPEEIRGKMIDFRTDIWSLGVVMYEMLTNKLPFEGEYDQEVIFSILNEKPLPIIDLRSDVPVSLEKIILKTLEKNPDKRYVNMEELSHLLKRILSKISDDLHLESGDLPEEKSIKSIAVLPLVNLSGDPDKEYFAEGITDVLITALAKILTLKVISRTSIMRYKTTSKSIPEIAGELRVDTIVEGTVMRIGDNIQLSLQLIDAETDTHIWAESYNRNLQDISILQSELANTIAKQIKTTIIKQKSKRFTKVSSIGPEPYDNYLKGCFHLYKVLPDDYEKANEYFILALNKDPSFALAYTGIAKIWLFKNYWSLVSSKDSIPHAKKAAQTALDLDNNLEEAHDVMARIKFFYEWDWTGAENEFKQAIDINPNYVDSRLLYSAFLRAMKRDSEALNQVNFSLDVDPLSSMSKSMLVAQMLHMNQYDEAIRKLREIQKTDPDSAFVHRYLWIAYQQEQNYNKALEAAKQYFASVGKIEISDLFALRYTDLGYNGVMELVAEKLMELSKHTYVQPIWIARLYAYAENKENALKWLEISFEERDQLMVNLAVSKDWHTLRNDSRFKKLLKKMKLD